ncbi:uncharacterized protein VP01_3970g2, partial [Puccinia sorghi]
TLSSESQNLNKNCIALLIQLKDQEVPFKTPLLGKLTDEKLGSHLLILEYLSSCKTNSSRSNKEDGKIYNEMTLKPLYHLKIMIINLFIKYFILCGSSATNVEPDSNSTQIQALVTQKKDTKQSSICLGCLRLGDWKMFGKGLMIILMVFSSNLPSQPTASSKFAHLKSFSWPRKSLLTYLPALKHYSQETNSNSLVPNLPKESHVFCFLVKFKPSLLLGLYNSN